MKEILIFVAKLEKKILRQITNTLLIWKRFIEDILCFLDANEESLDLFVNSLLSRVLIIKKSFPLCLHTSKDYWSLSVHSLPQLSRTAVTLAPEPSKRLWQRRHRLIRTISSKVTFTDNINTHSREGILRKRLETILSEINHPDRKVALILKHRTNRKLLPIASLVTQFQPPLPCLKTY